MLALLLHGQPGSKEDWEPVQAALGSSVDTLAIDRPGYDGVAPAGGVADSGRATIAALDRAGADRAVLVGFSYGGAVAVWVAIHHPDRVAGLVLIAPAANLASIGRLDHILAAPVVGTLLTSSALVVAHTLLSAARVRRAVARQLKLTDAQVGHAAQTLSGPARRRTVIVEQRALLDELPEIDARLGEIVAPTQIIYGSVDHVVSPAAARRLGEQIPRAELHEIARAGHTVISDHPAEVAELIARAVSTVADPGCVA